MKNTVHRKKDMIITLLVWFSRQQIPNEKVGDEHDFNGG